MAALLTDQFRIFSAKKFIKSLENPKQLAEKARTRIAAKYPVSKRERVFKEVISTMPNEK